MFEAFLSGKLASEAVLDVLAGRAEGLEPYGERLTRMLGTHLWASWGVKAALDRFPRVTFRIARSRIVWRTVERLVRGDIEDVRGARGLARPPLKALEALARVAGRPGRSLPPGLTPYHASVQNYLVTTLDGGTRVVTEPLQSVRSVAIGLWIGAGSRDEDDAHAGLSHFLEHMLFKGTASYSALEIAEIFDTFGGELNAATARDYTVVYARVLDEHLDTALDVMTDMVFAPSLDDLDSEREVVLEEIAMVEDSPQELIFDLVTKAVFGDHPLGRPVLGSADVISTVSRRSVGAFHRRRYRPDNVVVATAGSVDHDRLVEAVDRMRKKAAEPPARRSAVRRAARRAPAARARLPAEGDGAVPRLPRRPGNRALGPPPLHGVHPRRRARRLGLVPALPGDPREARPRLRRVHVLLAVRGHGADRGLRRHEGGEPRRVPAHRRRADRRHLRARPAARRARAREGEPQGPDHALPWSSRRTG